MMGWDDALLLLVASYVLQAVAAPKAASTTQKPTAFEDIDFPQTEEGTAQAVIFGDVWTKDYVILGLGNYRTAPIKSSGGGKK